MNVTPDYIGQTNVAVGFKLHRLRSDKWWTRQKLSDLSGVPVITIKCIETGQRAAPIQVMLDLCNALGVDLCVILDQVQTELEGYSWGNPASTP